MPSLREFPIVVRQAGAVGFGRKVLHEINDDNLFTWASALAYSWLFAIFPFFLVLLSLIPMLRPTWKDEAIKQIDSALKQLPHEAQVTLRQYVEPKLKALIMEKPKGFTGIWSVGLLVTLWAASGGMAMTMAALDRAHDVPKSRPIYKQRPLAVMLTVIVAALILSVVILVPVGTVVTRFVTSRADMLLTETGIKKALTTTSSAPSTSPNASTATAPSTTSATTEPTTQAVARTGGAPEGFFFFILLWQIFRYGIAALFLFWVVALVYYFGPNVKQKFRLLTPGSVFTVGTWCLLGVFFRFYIDTFGKYGQTYGAVGGVIILLFFFYIDALVLLIGAEINAEADAVLRASAVVPLKETQDTIPGPETP